MEDPARLPEYLSAALNAARAGAAVLESWRGRFTAREKGRADLVSEADQQSQDAVKGFLLGRFPGHQFVGEEESGSASRASPLELADPPD